MLIHSLSVESIRNIQHIDFTPSAHINVIYGENGSGKTSLLEAIHFLGLARSFRTSQFRYLINNKAPSALVFSQLDAGCTTARGSPLPLGVSRNLEGDVKIRYQGQSIELAELAALLPLQVINTDTFALLEGAPAERRQFIDWGVFHFEPRFIQIWRAFRRIIQQRNSLLKCGKIDSTLRQVWDREFVLYAQEITRLRQAYLEALEPELTTILAHLLAEQDIQLHFSPGWDQKRDLDELLADNLHRDIKQGFTSAGPQRADLKVKADGILAAERLSRGQKKLVVSALKLAQGALFYRQNARACVYLIDDLPSELDETHGRFFCEFLEQTKNQCFITCVDPDLVRPYWKKETQVAYFRLEAGQIIETD